MNSAVAMAIAMIPNIRVYTYMPTKSQSFWKIVFPLWNFTIVDYAPMQSMTEWICRPWFTGELQISKGEGRYWWKGEFSLTPTHAYDDGNSIQIYSYFTPDKTLTQFDSYARHHVKCSMFRHPPRPSSICFSLHSTLPIPSVEYQMSKLG